MGEKYGIHLGIDAINIRQGGGLTHLSEFLKAGNPNSAGISHVTVFVGQETALALPVRPWLTKVSMPWMDLSLPKRIIYQQFGLPAEIKAAGCDILFSPGGTSPVYSRVPVVSMSQNMLPFEPIEAARFGRFSLMRLKMMLLSFSQRKSFLRANGLIFLSEYAKSTVTSSLGSLPCPTALIPHGVDNRFLLQPRDQRPLSDCTPENPFKVLYVSIFMPYKHQVEVARAASLLKSKGIPIQVRFIGAPWASYGREFRTLLTELDPKRQFLLWSGAKPFDSLHEYYHQTDAFVFASSCENLPNILIEAMAASLPIACSSRGPMPEVLGDAGVYFDPESPESIERAIEKLAYDHDLRSNLAKKASKMAKEYSWERCARETFDFVAYVARRYS